jgi:hypothetical protein
VAADAEIRWLRFGTIPKEDGSKRPLAVAALEDKIVQRATAAVLSAIFEEDFLGFSYGFRPKRSQHDALGRADRRVQQQESEPGYIGDRNGLKTRALNSADTEAVRRRRATANRVLTVLKTALNRGQCR